MRHLCLCAAFILFSAAGHAAVKISTVTVTPGAVTGGTSATGTVTLTTGAGHGGAVVTLTSSNTAVATVPANVTVPQNATSATFTVTTSPVASSTTVTISASLGGTATASFTVVPPALSNFTLSPTTVTAVTGTSTGTVTLNGNAPSGGVVVTLSSASSAAVVPASVTIPAGSASASFAITTKQVTSQTNATLTATFSGNTRVATLTINHCTAAPVSPVSSFPATDNVWIDDSLPAGMTSTGATWDTSQRTSGMQSLTAGESNGFHEMLFTGATSTLAVHPSESMITYLLVSECATPREIVFGWHTASGSWVKAYYGQALIGGESNMVSLGAVPAPGAWQLVSVSAAALGIQGATVDGFDVQMYDGQAWIDRAGKTCVQPFATGTVTSTDTLWIDDNFPSGASGPSGSWDNAQHISGTRSLTTGPIAAGQHSLAITGATSVLPVYIGEKLVLYTLLDMCSPPTELMVRWTTTAGETHAVYWGTPHNIGENTAWAAMGAMPSAGMWIRLEVPASLAGLEQRSITGVSIDTWDGRAWFDGIGKGGVGCAPAVAAAPSIPAGDTVWMEDAAPSGAVVNGGVFDPTQHASGSQSFTFLYAGGGQHSISMDGAATTMPLAFGEKVVAYVLINACAVPNELAIRWHTTSGVMRGVYWGAPHGWGEGTTLTNMGAMPAAASWFRVEVPVETLHLQQTSISGFDVQIYDGNVWIDHLGKSGTACYTAYAQPPSSLPSTDIVWIDDYSTTTGVWDTSQKASGSASLTQLDNSSGPHSISVTGAQTLTIASGDKLFAYVLLNECAPPSEILLQWQTTDNVQHQGVYLGTPHGLGEGSTYFSLGPLPTPGVWTRIEVPASQLGIEGKFASSVSLQNVDGQVWFDRFGLVPCSAPHADAPSLPAGDTVWIDDALPSGASGNPTWDTSQAASGTRSISGGRNSVNTALQTYSLSLPVYFSESLTFYALIDPCGAPPSELHLEVTTDNNERVRAFWGTPTSEPSNAVNMGAIPAAGVWQRLSVAASALKIETRRITSIEITYYGGHAWFDRIGKSGTACAPPSPSQPSFPSTDVVWADDDVPAGSSGQVSWDTSQAASGTRSLSIPYAYDNTRRVINFGQIDEPVYIGQSLAFYVLLDACAMPTQVSVSGWDNTGSLNQAYWGTPNGDEIANAINMGPLPAAGQWQRLAVPFALWHIEEHHLGTLTLSYVGGHAWIDHIGAGGNACIPAHAAPVTTPSTDVVFFNESNLPSGSYWYWDANQSTSSGGKALTQWYAYSGRHDFNFGQIDQPVAIGESVVFYALLDECAPPTQVSVAAWDNTGRMNMAYWGAANGDELPNAVYMGPLPAPGAWHRYTVPMSAWQIEEHHLGTFSLSNVNGHVWYDHIGRDAAGCASAHAAPVTTPSTDVVFFNESNLPANSYWYWDANQSTSSGGKSLTQWYAYSGRHDFNFGQIDQPVYVGDSVVFYALLDECAPPTQVSVAAWDNTGRMNMAYWGTANGDEIPNAVYMGPLPSPGAWNRYTVPMSTWQIEEHHLGTFSLSNVNGHVWYDHIGRDALGCVPATAAQPSIPAGDTVLVDDDVPAGTGSGDLMWDTSQAASGTRSLTQIYSYSGRHRVQLSPIDLPFATGEKVVLYVLLDACAPPTQISIAGWHSGHSEQAYWGTASGDELPNAVSMGPLPGTGSWVRLEVPASTLNLEGDSLNNMEFSNVDGHAWYDHFGKSQ